MKQRSSSASRKLHPLITGTAILTLAGLLSRFIGFFYRIYLSRVFGEEGMGVYQLISPVVALSYSLSAAGYQTAISKLVAERNVKPGENVYLPILTGLMVTLPLSALTGFLVFRNAAFIASELLFEPRCTILLQIIAFSFPFVSTHSCINGFFYGQKKAAIPAFAQIFEQLTRVTCVFLLSGYFQSRHQPVHVGIAVFGLALGEAVSMLIALTAILITKKRNSHKKNPAEHTYPQASFRATQKSLLALALPLSANRLILNFLQSVESVCIPASLRRFGYSTADALSVYGVLTGMAMPFIFFPNAVIGSVSVLLLPIISENHALGNRERVKEATLRTIRYCLAFGFFFLIVFLLTGKWAGNHLFHSSLAGHFIQTLGFLCPFMYLDITLSSILQGLGMAGEIFVSNVLCLALRLGFVFFLVPRLGITGYLWGILTSQILLSLLLLLFAKKHLSRKH